MNPETVSTNKPRGWRDNWRQAGGVNKFLLIFAVALFLGYCSWGLLGDTLLRMASLITLSLAVCLVIMAGALIMKNTLLAFASYGVMGLLFICNGAWQIVNSSPTVIINVSGWMQVIVGGLFVLRAVIQLQAISKQQINNKQAE